MFAPYCPSHGSRVLLFSESIISLERSSHGMRIRYRCTCGHQGVWDPCPEKAIDAA